MGTTKSRYSTIVDCTPTYLPFELCHEIDAYADCTLAEKFIDRLNKRIKNNWWVSMNNFALEHNLSNTQFLEMLQEIRDRKDIIKNEHSITIDWTTNTNFQRHDISSYVCFELCKVRHPFANIDHPCPEI